MHKIAKVIANVYDGDDFEDLKHLAADGHKVEIVEGWVFVNYCSVNEYRSMNDITERIALEDRNA